MKDWINKIHCGNCLEIMNKISSGVVDFIFADPPYNAKDIGPHKKHYIEGRMQLPPEEYIKFCKEWFMRANNLCKRIVLTPGIANTHNYPQPYWQITWHKPAAVSFNRMGGYNAWEPIFIYSNSTKRIGQDYIKINTLNFNKGIEKDHPCPKPLELMIWIIEHFTKINDVVLDPFIGSGTTAVACKILKRNYIGIDIVNTYKKMSDVRVKAENRTLWNIHNKAELL